MKRWRLLVVATLVGLGGAAAAVVAIPDLTPRADRVPTTRATLGDVIVRLHTAGELSARKSAPLVAPPVGATLQIVKLLPAGAEVHAGDVVVEFDRAEQQYNLQQAESDLAEAEEELVKIQADAKVQEATDQLDLLHAKYALRLAQIAVTGNEFVGSIKARENLLDVDKATQALAQIEGDITSHAASSRAGVAVQEEKRTKARIAADLARHNIESMTLRAPMDGLIVLRTNRNAAGGFYFTGMTLPDFRNGDNCQPGEPIADVVDLSEMEIRAKVPEAERPLLAKGAHTDVRMEALPAAKLSGSAKGVAGLAQHSMWDASSTRQFDAAFTLDGSMPMLRPGMTVRLTVQSETLKGVTHLPRQALFERSGKSVVYVRDGSSFKPVEVKVARLTETRVVLEGFSPDLDVALIDPTAAPAGAPGAAGPATQPGGAR